MLKIPTDWIIEKNEFSKIEDMNEISKKEMDTKITYQKNILSIHKGLYHINLGWHGSDKFSLKTTGFKFILFKGKEWENCELLELLRRNSIIDLPNTINKIIKLVSDGFYDDKTGLTIHDGNDSFIAPKFMHSVRDHLNKEIDNNNK